MRGHKVLPSQSKYFPTESENFPIRAELPEGPQGMEYCTPKCNSGCFKINQSYTSSSVKNRSYSESSPKLVLLNHDSSENI